MENNEKIDISIEKSIKNTFLYIKDISINLNSYETKVLLEESIPSIIKLDIGYENENTIIKYDVSNLISLENYVELNKLKSKDYSKILNSLDEALSYIENYLISENSLLLELNSIFYDEMSGKLYFIVVPNLKRDFSFELSKLLIRLLRHVDIEEKETMNLAYRLFIKSSKENYTINDLLDIVNSGNKNIANNISASEKNTYEKEYYDDLLNENKNFEDDVIKDVDTNIDFMSVPKNFELNINDSATKSLKENIIEDFHNEEKSNVINIKNIFSKNKLVNAHFKFQAFKMMIILFFTLIIPLILYIFYGGAFFINNIFYIILYEVLITLFIYLNNILEIIEKTK